MTDLFIILSILVGVIFISVSLYKIVRHFEDYMEYTKTETKAKFTSEDYDFKHFIYQE